MRREQPDWVGTNAGRREGIKEERKKKKEEVVTLERENPPFAESAKDGPPSSRPLFGLTRQPQEKCHRAPAKNGGSWPSRDAEDCQAWVRCVN